MAVARMKTILIPVRINSHVHGPTSGMLSALHLLYALWSWHL
jgi:hypothetical protein